MVFVFAVLSILIALSLSHTLQPVRQTDDRTFAKLFSVTTDAFRSSIPEIPEIQVRIETSGDLNCIHHKNYSTWSSSKRFLCEIMNQHMTQVSERSASNLMFLLTAGETKYKQLLSGGRYSTCSLLGSQSLMELEPVSAINAAEHCQNQSAKTDSEEGINQCDLIYNAWSMSNRSNDLMIEAEKNLAVAKDLEATARIGQTYIYGVAAATSWVDGPAGELADAAGAVIDAAVAVSELQYSLDTAEAMDLDRIAMDATTKIDAHNICNKPDSEVLQCQIGNVDIKLERFALDINEKLNDLKILNEMILQNTNQVIEDVEEILRDTEFIIEELNFLTNHAVFASTSYPAAIENLEAVQKAFAGSALDASWAVPFGDKISSCNSIIQILHSLNSLLEFLTHSPQGRWAGKSLVVLHMPVIRENEENLAMADRLEKNAAAEEKSHQWELIYTKDFLYYKNLAQFFVGFIEFATEGRLSLKESYINKLLLVDDVYFKSIELIESSLRCQSGFHVEGRHCVLNVCTCRCGYPEVDCPTHGAEECSKNLMHNDGECESHSDCQSEWCEGDFLSGCQGTCKARRQNGQLAWRGIAGPISGSCVSGKVACDICTSGYKDIPNGYSCFRNFDCQSEWCEGYFLMGCQGTCKAKRQNGQLAWRGNAGAISGSCVSGRVACGTCTSGYKDIPSGYSCSTDSDCQSEWCEGNVVFGCQGRCKA